MVDIKTLVENFKKHDIAVGIVVGLLAVMLFKFSAGWVILDGLKQTENINWRMI